MSHGLHHIGAAKDIEMAMIPWGRSLQSVCDAHADADAINDGQTSLNYRTMGGKAARLAHMLLGYGVTPGEPVATMLPNSHAAVWGAFGVRLSGAAETPLNPSLGLDERRRYVGLTGARRIVTTKANAADFAALGCEPIAVEEVPDTPGDLGALPAVPGGAYGRISFTSGTTGAPKAIVQTHAARWIGALLQRATAPTPIGPGNRILLMTPYMHGASVLTMAFVDQGGAVVLLPGVDIDKARRLLEGGAVDHIFAPPTVLAKLVSAFAGRRFHNIRAVFCGTAPLTPTLYRQARELFGPVIRVTYGKTEMTNPITVLTPAECDAYYMNENSMDGICVGYPATGVEVQLRTGDDVVGSREQIGEIHLRSPHMSCGHIDDEGFQPLPDDCFHATGDLGRFDRRGRLHLVGRTTDVMKSGGYKVHPYEIESVLSSSAGGGTVAIVSIPSDYWGEVIVAVAEGADAGWPERARDALGGLARHKHPRQFVIVGELPRNVQGKVVRKKLRELLLSQHVFEDGPYPRLVERD